MPARVARSYRDCVDRFASASDATYRSDTRWSAVSKKRGPAVIRFSVLGRRLQMRSAPAIGQRPSPATDDNAARTVHRQGQFQSSWPARGTRSLTRWRNSSHSAPRMGMDGGDILRHGRAGCRQQLEGIQIIRSASFLFPGQACDLRLS